MDFQIPMLPVQKEFYNAIEPFVAIVSSRSCGKSWIAIFCALVDLLKGKNVLYMSQTDGAFYKGPWLHLMKFLRDFNLAYRWSWNSTYKTGRLDVGNGIESRFYMASYEVEDSSRGATECSSLYLDEFTLSKPNILAVTAPCLRGTDNFGNIIVPKIRATGTPNMASLWQLMLVEPEKYGIRLLRTKMSENVFMTDEQRNLMSSVIFDDNLRRQEIEGEIILGEDSTSIISLNDFPKSPAPFHDQTIYAGLDMAHTGQRDSHVFCATSGNRLLALHEFGICEDVDVAMYIRKFVKSVGRLGHLSMDLAWSESIYTQLKYELPCSQISFAAKPPVQEAVLTYANFRGWGYFHAAECIKEGFCLDTYDSPWIDPELVAELKRELCNTHFVMDRMGRLLIEPKDNIKMRIGRSPDPADAFMLALSNRAAREDPIMAGVQSLSTSDIETIMSED